MKVPNALRWVALPFVVLLVAWLTDGLTRWLLGILISNHDLWVRISQSVSNITCGIIVIIIAYLVAPKAKDVVALVTTVICIGFLGAITSLVLIFDCDNQSSANLLELLTFYIGPLIGYFITTAINSVGNWELW